jgi:hypothetical protein
VGLETLTYHYPVGRILKTRHTQHPNHHSAPNFARPPRSLSHRKQNQTVGSRLTATTIDTTMTRSISIRHPLLLLICATTLCYGCTATRAVYEAGVTEFTISPIQATSLDNGSVLVKAELLSHPTKRQPVTRYILGSPEVLQQSLWKERWTCQPNPVSRSIPLVVTPPGMPGWQMYPYSREGVNADPSTLPFPMPTKWVNRQPHSVHFNYLWEDRPIKLYFYPVQLPREMRREVSWWHWPMQALAIPAWAFDIATFPFQAAIVAREITP